MPQGARAERVGEEFREILAEEIQRLKDPRIGFVTVTGVSVSPDLRHARVFYTALGDGKARAASRAALRSATSYLRRTLGAQVRMKLIPELAFEEDPSIAIGERIDLILADLGADLGPDLGPEGDEP